MLVNIEPTTSLKYLKISSCRIKVSLTCRRTMWTSTTEAHREVKCPTSSQMRTRPPKADNNSSIISIQIQLRWSWPIRKSMVTIEGALVWLQTLVPNQAFLLQDSKVSMVQTIKCPKTHNSSLIGAAWAKISLLQATTHPLHKKMRKKLDQKERCTWLTTLLNNR